MGKCLYSDDNNVCLFMGIKCTDGLTTCIDYTEEHKSFDLKKMVDGYVITNKNNQVMIKVSKKLMASKADNIIKLIIDRLDEIDNMKW